MTQYQIEADNGLTNANVVVGIPCYNEEDAIARVIVGLSGIADKIIVCDDGSDDMTADIARALGCQVIRHERNMGKGVAMRSLFKAARQTDADVFVTIDGDGQHSPADIPRLVMSVLSKGCDIAIGSRYVGNSSDMPVYRRFGSKVLNSVINKSFKISVKDTQSGLRAYSKEAIAKISTSEDGMAVDTEILAKASSLGMRVKEFPAKISYGGSKTSTKDPVSHSAEVLGSTIKFLSIGHPLKFYGVAAVIFFVSSVLIGVWTVFNYLHTGILPLGLTLITISLFIISGILAAIAIIIFSLTTVVRELHQHKL